MKNREIIAETVKNANLQTLKKIINGLKREQILTQSSSVTYFLLISIIPFFIVILAIVGFTGIDVLSELDIKKGDIPDNVYKIINVDFSISAGDIDLTTVIFMVGVLFMASSFFNRIIGIGKKIYDEDSKLNGFKGNIIINKLLSIVLLLIIIGMITLHIYLSNQLNILIDRTGFIFESSYGGILNFIIQLVFSSASIVIILMAVNWFISPSKMNFRKTFIGSSITYFIWHTSTFIFFDLIEHSPIWRIFGDLAIYVVFIYWVFLLAYGFIVGIIVNKEYIYEKYFN